MSRIADADREALRARVREDLPSCADPALYLNIGGAGPMARACHDAAVAALGRGFTAGRATLPAVEAMAEVAAGLRAKASALVGGGPIDAGLTGNTTHGVDIAVWGIEWRPGDEVITTVLEHPGVSVPLGLLARRVGVRVRFVDADTATADLGAGVRALAGPRTRMVVVSHVAYGTGAVLDVAGAAAAAHEVGALCVVDGAQSVGAIPVDAPPLGADAYAFPAHKWLCGPEGLGAVWVAPHALERIRPTFGGYESGTGHTPDGGVDLHPGGRRYELSTPPMSLLGAWSAGLDWLDALGWEWIHARIAAGRRAAVDALSAIPGVTVVHPDGPAAGLVTFTIDGHDAVAACAELARLGVIVRWLEHPRAMRASIGFHWCDTDIERLAAAVAAVSGC